MGQHKHKSTPAQEPYVELTAELTAEEKAHALNELRKLAKDPRYTPNLPPHVKLLYRPIKSFAERRATATCRNYQYGKPYETIKYEGQPVLIRDEYGLSLDPLQWADPECKTCQGRAFLLRLRPMTAEKVMELLEEHKEVAGSILCRHFVPLTRPCLKCGQQRDRDGLSMATSTSCSCTDHWYQKAKYKAAQTREPVFKTERLSEAIENRQRLKDAGITRIQCQHGRSLEESCLKCGRSGSAVQVEDEVQETIEADEVVQTLGGG